MSPRLFTLVREKGLISLAALGKSYALDELSKFARNFQPGITIHRSAQVASEATFGSDGRIVVYPDVRIRKYAVIAPSGGRVEIGENSMLNVFSTLLGHGSIRIGRDVLIGPHTTIVAANHTFNEIDVPIVQQEISKKGVLIHDDVWIGANCTILDGVTIDEGAVVAAGSVVTESVPENSVVAGVPAKRIGTRGNKHSE